MPSSDAPREQPKARLRLPGSHWALAAVAYLLFTIVITYPVVLRLGSHMAGEGTGDTLEFVWSMWWWKYALLDLRQDPMHITVLNYPFGIEFPLLPLMSQSFLLGLPIAALASPVAAYNLVFLASFVACGLAGYALCAELSGDRAAGFIGGLIWAFFPNKLGHALAGHLFQLVLFAFPLAALAWSRLSKSPTTRNAVWAALALALSATVHPVYLAYFLAPLVVFLIGGAWWAERERFIRPANLRAVGIALGLSVGLIAPLLAPAIARAAQGRLNFLVEKGAVGFAFDALAYFLPPPNNPILLRTPLAPLADRVVLTEYESIGYVGWLALALAIVGARARWAESRVWATLAAVGGVLALGPLLKVGGGLVRAPVEDGWYPLVMPYSFIGSLPFFQWSRTPGRLDALVMLAVSVLAAHGFAHVRRIAKYVQDLRSGRDFTAETQRARGKTARCFAFSAPLRFNCVTPDVVRFAALALASGFIAAEYIVKFPFPTLPADAPAPLVTLRADTAAPAVIDLPTPDNNANLRSLYWQTIHQHALVGGRVYRDAPGGGVQHSFLSRLLLSDEEEDIAPQPTEVQRRAVLDAVGVGWVLYDSFADPDGGARALLEARFGPPAEEGGGVALFSPTSAGTDGNPPLQADDLIWTLGENWYAPQNWGGAPGRWFRGQGEVFVFSGGQRTGRLAFTAVPGLDLHRLTVRVNGESVGRFAVGDWAEYQTAPVALNRGLNRIEFVDEDGARGYVGDPRCAGGSPVSGPFPVAVSCEPADRTARDLSLLVSNLRLIPEDARLPLMPGDVVFGGAAELLGFAAPEGAGPGQAVRLHLMWRAAAAMDEDFTVFVHLLGPDGALAAGADSAPVGGAYPTSRWAVGDVVAYNVTLALPADAAAGEYTLELGMYRWPSLERLPVSGGGVEDNAAQLSVVMVEPGMNE